MPVLVSEWNLDDPNPNEWSCTNDGFGTFIAKKRKVVYVDESITDEELLERLRKKIKTPSSCTTLTSTTSLATSTKAVKNDSLNDENSQGSI